MAFLEVSHISKEYVGRWVLRDGSFELAANQKVGLIGPNGSGKTTLLKIITGFEPPDEGRVNLTAEVRIGYVPQHVAFAEGQTVSDYLLSEHQGRRRRLRALEHAVSENHNSPKLPQLLSEYQLARDDYDRHGGDLFEQRAAEILDALGLAGREQQAAGRLSGGEQNVLTLAAALLNQPNLLILDEPGNHLDYLGLAWLDDFLSRFRGAVLIVSHNRYMLDRIADSILEIDDGKLEMFPGNYTAYKHIKAERRKAQMRAYEAWQERLAHIEKIVQKFADIAQGHSTDPAWGKRLRARRSQLEHEKAKNLQKPKDDKSPVKARFIADKTRADIALRLEDYSCYIGELELFNKVNWDIGGGERWALVGPNGSGKTTLLNDIVTNGSWEHRHIRIGPSLTIGYAAQQQELLDPENTVYEELLNLPGTTHQKVLDILARFLFTDLEITKQIANLSGGERNRLQLARLMLIKPNFLILDEPTNHLDIATREAVEQALRQFEGTLLVVSHDRWFLDAVVDHVAEVDEKSLRFYSGNFTTYWQKRYGDKLKVAGRISQRGRQRTDRCEEQDKPKTGGRAWQERKAASADLRKKQKRVEMLEGQIAEAEAAKARLETDIAAAYTAGDNDRGHALSEELTQLAARIETLIEDWTQATHDLEATSAIE
ncbi:MAG: ABC-F family ATP-binding cassette domain-containing protein [Sedimentisphaerales bacterium]|nr:ABC-F family ATP-binding cassette domain-containing protein [Sedimentisphaerales bacterium]